MCKTMNELEKVVADYRGLKALKEQVEELEDGTPVSVQMPRLSQKYIPAQKSKAEKNLTSS